ncbi:class II glutamine amidotransferase [Minwuia thermotolerans]|uniref:Class II glutamine amidotransferase n=1 Tax=Minwuia thermotolerans TaxID=2056226 RepID=A0A2M9FWW7_9PROT|nr:class II glutamine amidotransferase [Minwuia thermotolerans]PJK27944.1 class II glutamine amidotransferase [Minwuia thermotolerans]
MCRLYALRANEPTRVECGLVRSQNNLMRQSQGDAEGLAHGHGWGVAEYPDGVPMLERQTWAAFHGEHFAKKAARVYAHTVIAHVRRATVGSPRIENTHPFVFGRYIFAHNGTLPNFEAIRPRLLEHVDPLHHDEIRGDTDSEHVFHYLLTRWAHGPQTDLLETVREGVERIVRWCAELAPGKPVGLNIVLGDGERMVGTRLNRTLWYLERDGLVRCDICGQTHVHHKPRSDYRSAEVASEPVTPEEAWRQVPNGTVYAVDPDYKLHFEPLRLPEGALREAG